MTASHLRRHEESRAHAFLACAALVCTLLFAVMATAQERRRPFRGRAQSFAVDAGLGGATVMQIVFDARGHLWAASEVGLLHYDGYRWQRFSERHGLPSRFVRGVYVDERRRQVWAGTDKGIAVASCDPFTVVSLVQRELVGQNVRRIRAGRDGSVWVCSDQWLQPDETPSGVSRFDRRSGRWRNFTKRDGLPSNYAMDVFLASDGSTFVLTKEGLGEFVGDRFTKHLVRPHRESEEKKKGDSDRWFWCMAEGPGRELIATTQHGLFLRVDGRWESHYTWQFDNPQILMSTDLGLVMPRPRFARILFPKLYQTSFLPDFQPFPFHDSLQRIEDVVEAPDGAIWAAGRNLFVRWQPDSAERYRRWRQLGRKATVQFSFGGKDWGTTPEGFREVADPRPRQRPYINPAFKGTIPLERDVRATCTWPRRAPKEQYLGTDRGLYIDDGELTFVADSESYQIEGMATRGDELWFCGKDTRDGVVALRRFHAGRFDVFPIAARKFLGAGPRAILFQADDAVCVVPANGDGPYLVKLPFPTTVVAAMIDDAGQLWVDAQTCYLRLRHSFEPPNAIDAEIEDTFVAGSPVVARVTPREFFIPVTTQGYFAYSTSLDGGDWTPYQLLVDNRIELTDVPVGAHRLEIRLRGEDLKADATPTVLHFEVMRAGLPWWLFASLGVVMLAGLGFLSVRLRRRTARFETLRRLMRQAGSALVTVDDEGRIFEASDAARELLAIRRGQLGEVRLGDLAEDAALARQLLRKLVESGAVEDFECEFRTDSGVPVATVVHGVAADSKGYHLHLRNVTSERAVAMQLRQAQKMEGIGRLAGGIAHDFNNMLSGILGNAELIRERLGEEGDAEVRECAEQIVETSCWARDLTGQLLTFSRQSMVASAPVDLHSVIEDVHKLLSRTIDPRIETRLNLQAENAAVLGDASQLHSALLNLAINARDAMPSGGLMVLETADLALSGDETGLIGAELEPGRYVQVRVSDSGVGIERANIKRVFDPFFTTKEVGQGTGMGLAAVYGSVVAHKGAIRLRSEVGIGTTFDLILPVTTESVEAAVPLPPPDAKQRSGTILVADDELVLRRFVDRVLRAAGYRVLLVEDGAKAVSVFESRADEIDLCILDMRMPKLSGGDALRKIRACRPGVNALVVTGFVLDEAEVRQLDCDVLKKPFDTESFLAAVARALGATADGERPRQAEVTDR